MSERRAAADRALQVVVQDMCDRLDAKAHPPEPAQPAPFYFIVQPKIRANAVHAKPAVAPKNKALRALDKDTQSILLLAVTNTGKRYAANPTPKNLASLNFAIAHAANVTSLSQPPPGQTGTNSKSASPTSAVLTSLDVSGFVSVQPRPVRCDEPSYQYLPDQKDEHGTPNPPRWTQAPPP